MHVFPGRETRARAQYGGRRRFVHSARRRLAVALAFVMCALASGAASARALRLLALGDSLTAGYMLPEKNAFPAVLEAALRAGGLDVEVINAGVSGDTASAALERLDWSLDGGADIAIVEVGANDMLRGVDPAVTRAAIAAILAKLKSKGVAPLLVGMVAAPGMGRDYETRFNAIYPDLARESGAPLYPFFLDGVAGERALSLADGLHPNAAGVRVIVERMMPAVRKLIAGVGPRT